MDGKHWAKVLKRGKTERKRAKRSEDRYSVHHWNFRTLSAIIINCSYRRKFRYNTCIL